MSTLPCQIHEPDWENVKDLAKRYFESLTDPYAVTDHSKYENNMLDSVMEALYGPKWNSNVAIIYMKLLGDGDE